MQSCDVAKLQNSCYEDPCFVVDVFNLGRGFVKDNDKEHRIVSIVDLLVWRIVEEKLLPVEHIGIFYNTENYLIQWTFEYVTNNQSKVQTVFFYWRGSNATKGLSPLPERFENDTSIVERVVQWSEPAVFFHIFPMPVVVLNEKFGNLNPKKARLFIVRGELQNELHLFELPYLKKNLRSRGLFVIVVPNKEIIYVWKGSKITKKIDIITSEFNIGNTLKGFVKSWNNFEILEIKENDEGDLFEGDTETYFHLEEECNFSPRLFYLNSITGEFLATEVEYPLRSKNCIAAFPFLQSHICTADPPGLFLLDNNHEIWLVLNGLKSESYEDFYNVGVETANNYAKLREQNLKKPVAVNLINTDTDLIKFTNIFPYWN